jgi:hypothetical protein
MSPTGASRVASDLMTLVEAAAYLRVPVATLRYWRHLGSGPAGGRRVMYRREDVERWIGERQQAQAPIRPAAVRR